MTGLHLIIALVLAVAPLPEAKPDKAKIEALIARLRSANKEPQITYVQYPGIVGESVEFPRDYDHKAQDAVWQARFQLAKMGKDAFPFLIEHRNDKEYSLSIGSCGWSAFSVGDICLMIVEDEVDIVSHLYKARFETRHFAPNYSYKDDATLMGRRTALRNYYDEHKSKTLKEMQIERLEWAIAQEKAIGFPGEKDKEYYLIPLERQLAELKKK